MDHREHARLAAIVSRRRAQLLRLEQLITDVRMKLADDERMLALLKGTSRGPRAVSAADVQERDRKPTDYKEAGRTLSRCARTRDTGPECSEAGKLLQDCSKRKKRTA
jgi:hypothetical protein